MKYDDFNCGVLDSESGGWDILVMCFVEMYLVCVEVYGCKGEYGKVIEDINVLCRCVVFKFGEICNEVFVCLYFGYENLSNEL